MIHEDLISVAMGHKPAELIIKGGNLVNVYTGEIYRADVLVKGDRIAYVGDVDDKTAKMAGSTLDASGKYLIPGLIDPHIHMIESFMIPSQFARAVVPRGTTSMITDFYEFYIIAGPAGIKFCLDDAKKSPLKTYLILMTQQMGLEHLGTFNREKEKMDKEMRDMLLWDETIGITELPLDMVLKKDPSTMDLIRTTSKEKKIYAGHFSYPLSKELQAYITTGASSDHESRTPLDAIARVRLGMRAFIREGSAAPDLAQVVKALTEKRIDSRYFALCSDDEDGADIINYGHMDHKVRKAVANGLDPVTAIQMATLNAAEAYNLDSVIGSIAPGKVADILLVNDLAKLDVQTVLANGKIAARNGQILGVIEKTKRPTFLRNTIRLRKKLTPTDFQIKGPKERDRVTVRVIGVEEGNIVSKWLTADLKIEDGFILPDRKKDILKISVIDCRGATGNMFTGLINGFGLSKGAIATTYNHVWQNLIVVGTNNEDMAVACNELMEVGGGFIAVKDRKVLRALPLPFGGVATDITVEEVAKEFEEMREAIAKLGCRLSSPIIALGFSGLPSIPECGVTDLGLVDSATMSLVDLIAE